MVKELSVIIPARNERFLQATIDDLEQHLGVDSYEILVGLDDYWPDPPLKTNPNVVVHHPGKRIGMKPMINRLVNLARGDYVMKVDAHCSFDRGYGRKLLEAIRPGNTVLGVRYELDADTWTRKARTNCDFRYLSHPSDPDGGLRGLAWHEFKKCAKAKGKPIAPTMTISGSGWLMPRLQFIAWGGLYEGPETGTFAQEGAEISLKTWLSGGEVKVVRDTWYAHWNRGKAPYALSREHRAKSIAYSQDTWLNNRWPMQQRDFLWLIKHFDAMCHPVPGWEAELNGEKPEVALIPTGRQGTIFKGLRNKYREAVTDLSVDHLWDHRLGLSEPLKRDRLAGFFDAYFDFVQQEHQGKAYTEEEIVGHPYFEYLVTHINQRDRKHKTKDGTLTDAGRQRTLRKARGGLKLYRDIKAHGMATPLECYRKDGNLILWRGYRRLVVAKTLGLDRVAVCQHKNEWTAKNLPAKFPKPRSGSITEIAARQFQTHQGKSTDKYWTHGYTWIYDDAFHALRNKRIKILELGVARGASLLLWHEAFPKAEIYGVDTWAGWEELAGDLERVRVFVGKQQDTRFLERQVIPNGPFDIIIDDAGHNPANQKISWDVLWPHVEPNGWYVVEDSYVSYLRRNRGRPNMPKELMKLVPLIYRDQSVMSVQFHYNLCLVRKGIPPQGESPIPWT
jgi:hypothetical protein